MGKKTDYKKLVRLSLKKSMYSVTQKYELHICTMYVNMGLQLHSKEVTSTFLDSPFNTYFLYIIYVLFTTRKPLQGVLSWKKDKIIKVARIVRS